MSNKTINTRILLKRDTYANWSTKNPTLSAGEYSYDTTNKIIKVGDGATAWNTLDSIHVLSSNVEDLIGIINNQVAEGNVVLSNDLMSDHIDALKTNVQTAQSTATEAAAAAATAQTTATEAKTTAEGASTSVTTLNTKVGDIPSTATATTVVGYVDERIAQSAAGVRFRGVFNSLEEVQDPLNGDVVIIKTTGEAASTKEYIYSKPTTEATGEWIELGDENLYETKAQAAAKLVEAKAYADGLAVNYDPAGSAATAEANAIAVANEKTTKELNSENGKSMIFNETDGGGAKFENSDNTWSFVGVNDGGKNGIAAQLYAVDSANGYAGAKLDITTQGMYYTVGSQTAADRMIPANKLATKGDVDSVLEDITFDCGSAAV